MVDKYCVYTVVALILLAILLAPLQTHSMSKAQVVSLKVSQSYTINGHEYVMLTPVVAAAVGAWKMPDTHAHTLNRGAIEQCHIDEEVVGTIKGTDGADHPMVALFANCDSGKYRIDTIWFTPPTLPVEEPRN